MKSEPAVAMVIDTSILTTVEEVRRMLGSIVAKLFAMMMKTQMQAPGNGHNRTQEIDMRLGRAYRRTR